jgi:hypothetical protein
MMVFGLLSIGFIAGIAFSVFVAWYVEHRERELERDE